MFQFNATRLYERIQMHPYNVFVCGIMFENAHMFNQFRASVTTPILFICWLSPGALLFASGDTNGRNINGDWLAVQVNEWLEKRGPSKIYFFRNTVIIYFSCSIITPNWNLHKMHAVEFRNFHSCPGNVVLQKWLFVPQLIWNYVMSWFRFCEHLV